MTLESAGADAERVRRLRWRARRGMRELDALLSNWLDRNAGSAAPATLDSFEALLAVEDDVLWRWCVGAERPLRADFAGLIDAFRGTAGR